MPLPGGRAVQGRHRDPRPVEPEHRQGRHHEDDRSHVHAELAGPEARRLEAEERGGGSVAQFTDRIVPKDFGKMPDEYRELLTRLLTIQADCEIGGPPIYVDHWNLRAPHVYCPVRL